MGVINKLFLLAIFTLSTYCWLVLFEFGPVGFVDGFTQYYERFMPEEEAPIENMPGSAPKRATAPVISAPPKK